MKVFDETVKRGRGQDRRPSTPWTRHVVEQIDEAVSQAWAATEIEARKLKPDKWLAATEAGTWNPAATINVTNRLVEPERLEIHIVYELGERHREQQTPEELARSHAFVDLMNQRQREQEARDRARRLLPAPAHPNSDGEASS